MKCFISKVLFAAGVSVLFGGILVNNTWADGNVGTSMFVTPMMQKILLTPGETYEGTIKVSNSNTALADLEYDLSVGSYSMVKNDTSEDDYGDVDISTKGNRNIMMDWISFREDSGALKPNEVREIPFTIKVPLDAPAGAQYASILVTDVGEADEMEEGVSIANTLQIASAIFANVAGETIKKGEILDNNIPSFLTVGPLGATSMVRNDGNVYTDAEYVLQVWPLFSDEEICTNEENPATSLVFPETSRYHKETCDLPVAGIFKAKQIVKIFGEESIVEKTIIVCPIWLLFIIIFVIAAIIIYIIAKVRKRGAGKKEAA